MDRQNYKEQAKPLLFSFREWLDRHFELLPFIILLFNAIGFSCYYFMFLKPAYKLANDTNTPIEDVLSTYSGSLTFNFIDLIGCHVFDASLICLLVLFAKSKGFRLMAKASMLSLFLISICNFIYSMYGFNTDLYLCLYLFWIYIASLLITIGTVLIKR